MKINKKLHFSWKKSKRKKMTEGEEFLLAAQSFYKHAEKLYKEDVKRMQELRK